MDHSHRRRLLLVPSKGKIPTKAEVEKLNLDDDHVEDLYEKWTHDVVEKVIQSIEREEDLYEKWSWMGYLYKIIRNDCLTVKAVTASLISDGVEGGLTIKNTMRSFEYVSYIIKEMSDHVFDNRSAEFKNFKEITDLIMRSQELMLSLKVDPLGADTRKKTIDSLIKVIVNILDLMKEYSDLVSRLRSNVFNNLTIRSPEYIEYAGNEIAIATVRRNNLPLQNRTSQTETQRLPIKRPTHVLTKTGLRKREDLFGPRPTDRMPATDSDRIKRQGTAPVVPARTQTQRRESHRMDTAFRKVMDEHEAPTKKITYDDEDSKRFPKTSVMVNREGEYKQVTRFSGRKVFFHPDEQTTEEQKNRGQ